MAFFLSERLLSDFSKQTVKLEKVRQKFREFIPSWMLSQDIKFLRGSGAQMRGVSIAVVKPQLEIDVTPWAAHSVEAALIDNIVPDHKRPTQIRWPDAQTGQV